MTFWIQFFKRSQAGWWLKVLVGLLHLLGREFSVITVNLLTEIYSFDREVWNWLKKKRSGLSTRDMCSNALVGSNLKCVIVIKCSVTNSAGPREKNTPFATTSLSLQIFSTKEKHRALSGQFPHLAWIRVIWRRNSGKRQRCNVTYRLMEEMWDTEASSGPITSGWASKGLQSRLLFLPDSLTHTWDLFLYISTGPESQLRGALT